MEPFRLALAFFTGFLLQLFFLPWIPLGETLLDPLLLLFVWVALAAAPSTRFLWVYGGCVGLLKDLATGGLFGSCAIGFALVGVLLGMSRHALERDDPLVQAGVAGVSVGVVGLVVGLLAALGDPAVGWNRWFWIEMPLAMAANGWLAVIGFPRLKRLLQK